VSLAKYRLDRTLIVSPIDGVVLDRRVDAGQTIAATLMTPELFVLAEDLTRMQLLADVSEADVGYVCRGQAATFHVNAYREREFSGRVRQVRNQPRSTGSVVTYTVVIDVENPDGLLRPGMPADVSIELVRRESVAKIANAALRFRPPLPPDRIRGMLDELRWPPAPAPIRVATEAAGVAPDEIAFVPPPIEPVRATLWRLVEQRWVPVPVWTAFTDNRETAVAGLDAADGEFVVEIRKAKSSESALQKAIMLARPEDRRSWLSRSDK
jgi:multidrug efflux pump subunit AcrA (membrane-fusion protein)